MKKILSAAAAVLIAMTIPFECRAAQDSLDVNGDGKVNVFDYILEKRAKPSSKELCTVTSDFLLRKGSGLMRDESVVREDKGTVHTGDGTFYGGGYVGGCAMLDPISKDDYWICAMNLEDYDDARLAGAYIELTGELGTINMFVSDLLPEGKKGDIDLYTEAFPLIAPVEKGRVPVSWKIVPLDSADKAPVSYKFKEGSSPFWCGVQVRNHRYPIAKLEYLNDKGEFVEINRRPYNFFESMDMGEGPFTFRVTDIYGDCIIDRDIPMIEDGISAGKAQFPE